MTNNYSKILNDVYNYIVANYILAFCVGLFIIFVIIGYFADRRRIKKQNKKKEQNIETVVETNNLPVVEEISMPALEPAIDITPEPDYEISYNNFNSINAPFILTPFSEAKMDIKTMSGTAEITPEIDKIFREFNFNVEEIKEEKVEEKIEDTKEPEVIEKEEIVENEEEIIDNDMDYEDLKPDKSIYDEEKPFSQDQDNINNLF